MSQPSYTEAFEELQQIVSEIEDGQISVDTLSEKVSRAAALIKICKQKLSETEDNVNEILAALERNDEDDLEIPDDEQIEYEDDNTGEE
ncbi:MAG: exodeoxyribonuclease VII small subunit [Chitinophagaceae bacterium]|nr:exodeoxyribonuclease VII small subunit [Chitinophagaceae bacterium]